MVQDMVPKKRTGPGMIETGPGMIERVGWYSIGVNVFLILLNLAVSIASGSLAVFAEMIHNLVDLISAVAVLVGLKVSKRSSRGFPYGLYKVENLVAVGIALLIFIAGYEIARQALFGSEGVTRVNIWILAGVVISGAHDMVTDRASWSERTAAWISELMASGTPLLGICYGHQLLAHALGGAVGPNPRGGEFGTVETKLQSSATKDRLFSGLPQLFQVQASHFQSVLSLPPGAILLASSNHDPHHAFSIANSAWGVQFHPEFSTEILNAYISKYKDTLAEHELEPEALLRSSTDAPLGREILRRFGQLLKKH